MGARDVLGRLLAGLATVVLAAGCAGNASLTPAPTPTPGPSTSPAPSVAPAVPARPPAAASQPQTLHLMETPSNVTEVRVGSLTGCTNTTSCQGDYFVADDPMSDATTGERVGTLAAECFIVTTGETLYHCPGITITLDGRGQIAFTEFFWGGAARPETSPISGGTGEFLGATGTVTSQSGGDFVITITR